jgi:hypothetical protein
MALQDRLFQEVRISCPGVTDDVIAQALWETLDDACRDAWVWRETVEVPLTVNNATYVVSVPGAQIVYPFEISHLSLNVSKTVFEFGKLVLNPDLPTATDVANGPAYFAAVLAPSMPSGNDPADVNPVGPDIEGWIPKDLWGLLHQTLVCGVKERLMAMPAKPWASAQMAAYWHRCYRSHKAVERRRAQIGDREHVRTWAYPSFFVPSRRH